MLCIIYLFIIDFPFSEVCFLKKKIIMSFFITEQEQQQNQSKAEVVLLNKHNAQLQYCTITNHSFYLA